MKALIITMFLSLSVILVYAQDSTNKKIANVSIPKRTKQISVSEFNYYAKQNFKTPVEPLNDGESFIAGKFLVSIHQMQLKYTIDRWKKSLEETTLEMGGHWDASKFMVYNDTRYYIFENHLKDESEIAFFSDLINGKTFSGFVKFKTADRDDAYKYLNELLSNVEFKK